MAGIGWNFGDDVSTAPPSSSLISSGWSNNYAPPPPQNSESHRQPSSRPIGIGFIIEEPPSPMAPQAKAPPMDMNSCYLGPAENPARRSLSVNTPKRPPPRQKNPTSLSFEVATSDGALANEPGRARSEMNSRPSSRSEAYERGLNDMADLMTTVDIDEAEKRRIRERFALK
ncbi:hypothetical protein ACTXT7_015102 [Hymenolepis weldensis]